jgi:hypothetical protein
MNKRKLHHVYTRFRTVTFWPLFAAFVIFGLIAVTSLRANNQHMLTLRNAVFQTDKDNGDIENALRDLRTYVYAHMNTNLASGNNPVKPPIQLKYTFERLQASEKQRVIDATTQVYVDAGINCDGQGLTTGTPRVSCVQAYIGAHPVTANPVPDTLYKFDFTSPVWSPDLAGWSILAFGLLGIVCLLWLVSWVIMHFQLKKHH